MLKKYHVVLVCILTAVTAGLFAGIASASMIVNDFDIYWNASGDDIDDAMAIAENYILPKLYAEAQGCGMIVNNVTVKYKPTGSGYFYPSLNSDIQSDLDLGLITLEENKDVTGGQVSHGYSWYYTDPRDAALLGSYINDDDELVRTYVFGAVNIPTSTVPIPGSIILVASGVGALIMTRKRKAYN